MSAPIGPGDFVECIDAEPCPTNGPVPLTLGEIYCILEVVDPAPNLWGWSVKLQGVRSNTASGRFGGGRFRPIYRRDEGLIQRLLQPIPAEPEQVTA